MSSFVYMKVLESAPERYDRGMHILSRGHIDAVYERIAGLVAGPGRRILDVGCGTGGVALACAARGAFVVGVDFNAGMLEVARQKAASSDLAAQVSWLQIGAAEIEDHFPESSFDAVVFCLVLSEMYPPERRYALRVARSRLRPGGMLAVADEVLPESRAARLWFHLRRLPLAALTYALTQTSTRPVAGLEASLLEAGFSDLRRLQLWTDAFVILHATKPDKGGLPPAGDHGKARGAGGEPAPDVDSDAPASSLLQGSP